MSATKGPSAFVSDAYGLGQDESVVGFYQKWADDYDNQMLEVDYVAPEFIAQLLCEHVSDKSAEILDVGCGTGLTCRLLADRGYCSLDGIDLSPDMIRVAGGQGIYRDLIVGDVNRTIERDADSYDAVISSGTFTHGHVGPEPFDEIFRILRPGGIFACTVHRDLWELKGFKDKFESLVAAEVCQCLQQKKGRYYETENIDGWFCVYQKLT